MQKAGVRYVIARFAGLGVAIFIAALSADQAFAVEYGGFGGRPAYPRADNPRTDSIFVHTLEPGTVQNEGVLLVNNSAEPKTILVYGVDSTPSSGGAFACAQASVDSKDVGAWIQLAKTEVTLEPGTNEVVPFTINVPLNASVGEHNGCIVMQEKKDKPEVGSGASLSFRTGLRVAISIPGELKRSLEIVDFAVSKTKSGFLLHPSVKNTGNVSIDANVWVVTRYFFGLELFKHGGQYPILRGETSDWNFELNRPFWGGLYRSDLIVEYDANPSAGVGIKSGKSLTRLERPSTWLFSVPTVPGLIIELLILAALIAVGFLLWLAGKRKKWVAMKWVMYDVRQGEDIMALAGRFGVSWKLLVKVNRLKPPYALSVGSKIKVPPAK